MADCIAVKQVTLQENGIIRDQDGNLLGRLVEDVDALCEKHYQRGYNTKHGFVSQDKIRDLEQDSQILMCLQQAGVEQLPIWKTAMDLWNCEMDPTEQNGGTPQ